MKKSKDKKIQNKIRREILFYQIISYFVITSGIIGFAILFNKVIETLIIWITFFIFRSAFPKELHSNSFLICVQLTLSIFFITIMSVLPNSLSYVAPVIFGFLICYITYLSQDYIDYKTYKNTKICRGMSKESLLEISKINNLDELEYNILYLYYCKRYKLWQIAQKLNYSESSIFKIKTKTLNKIKQED